MSEEIPVLLFYHFLLVDCTAIAMLLCTFMFLRKNDND